MSLQKLASIGRKLAGRNMLSPGVKSRIIPCRERSYHLAAPPRGKCSKTELIAMCTIMSCSIFFIPAWVIFHMKEYTAPLREADKQ